MKHFWIILLLLVVGCGESTLNNGIEEVEFKIDSIKVNLPHTTRDIIQIENGYLCRLDSYEQDSIKLLILNETFSLDKERTTRINKSLSGRVESIWTSNGTIYVVSITGSNYGVQFFKNGVWHTKEEEFLNEAYNAQFEQLIPIYEDDEYIVTSCCVGEWGGAIYFLDKKTRITYSCRSTCLVSINKYEGVYYVTSSLPHLSGHCSVIKIEDPRSLYKLDTKNGNHICNWYDLYSDDPKNLSIEHPMGYDNGYEILLDTFEVLMLGSFVHQNQIFYLYSNFDKAYIGQLEEGKLSVKDTLYNKPMWATEIRKLKNNATVFPVRNRMMYGIVIQNGNELKIVEFE